MTPAGKDVPSDPRHRRGTRGLQEGYRRVCYRVLLRTRFVMTPTGKHVPADPRRREGARSMQERAIAERMSGQATPLDRGWASGTYSTIVAIWQSARITMQPTFCPYANESPPGSLLRISRYTGRKRRTSCESRRLGTQCCGCAQPRSAEG